ncbi:MAG: aminotransferase class V-fold PLP-dependent enzyme [Clostridia bacterium]|nr:aminotransferase class V-fold PLP-dependent enzyme [Clostridia bacterium]MBQ5597433.1 aminotransferase class V-fold PLP-dependent enzyme [Clostridia bacterium]
MIYLDNAATTYPKPQSVIKAVDDALKKSANPGRSGHTLSQSTAISVYEVREKLKDMFSAPAVENVVFTLNCTHAINYVLKGLIKSGDRIVTSSFEHNAVMRPLEKLKKQGVHIDIAEAYPDDKEATVRSFSRLINTNTKLVICTAASNVIGLKMPIKEIGMMCKQFGISFCVDAAQLAGVCDINMKECNIDYLCIAAHKGLYAPMGTGVLITKDNRLDTIIEGGTGTASIMLDQPNDLPEMLESGTINVPGIIGLGAGIDFVKSKGFDKIYNHEMGLVKRLYKQLKSTPGVKLYTPEPDDNYAPVLSFNINGLNSVDSASKLNSLGFATRAGLHCAPFAHKRIGTIESGTVRICPSVFTSGQDIDKFAAAVRRISIKSHAVF